MTEHAAMSFFSRLSTDEGIYMTAPSSLGKKREKMEEEEKNRREGATLVSVTP